jgi:hypothetical protein
VTAANLVGAGLSTAVGFALQVSGFGGSTACVIAWALAAVLALVALSIFVRERFNLPLSKVLREVSELGTEMGNFFHMRESSAPPGGPQKNRLTYWRARSGEARELYDSDTMSLCDELFAERLVSVVRSLRKLGRIGRAEARTLMVPSEPAEIDDLSRRLIELGRQVD